MIVAIQLVAMDVVPRPILIKSNRKQDSHEYPAMFYDKFDSLGRMRLDE